MKPKALSTACKSSLRMCSVFIAISLTSGCFSSSDDQDTGDALAAQNNTDTEVFEDDTSLSQNNAGANFSPLVLGERYQLFQRVYLEPVDGASEKVIVRYTLEDETFIDQTVPTDGTSNIEFLIPPIDVNTSTNVIVSVNGVGIGPISVEPLPGLDGIERNPGELSLIASNALLFGLREDLESFGNVGFSADELSADSSLKALFISEAIDDFQQLLFRLDDVITFGGSLTQRYGADGEEVPDELEILDRLFHQLLVNVSISGVFFDGGGPAVTLEDFWDISMIGDTDFFKRFYRVATDRYSSLEGVKALSTLVLDSDSETKSLMDIVVASVFPAIAAQVIRADNPVNSEFLYQAADLLDQPGTSSSNLAYAHSKAALISLADKLSASEGANE